MVAKGMQQLVTKETPGLELEREKTGELGEYLLCNSYCMHRFPKHHIILQT